METQDNAAQAQPALQTSTSTATEGQPQARTFTQAELDQIITDRVKRASDSATKKLLDAIGVASVDELPTLKTTIEDARKRAQADMTESEKAKAELDRERKAKDDALTQLNTERAERRNDKIAVSLQSEAAKLKANDAETVLMYAREKHKAALDAVMAEDGVIDAKALTALLEKIKAEKPMYFTAPVTGAGSPSNSGGRVHTGNTDAQKRAHQSNQRLIRG